MNILIRITTLFYTSDIVYDKIPLTNLMSTLCYMNYDAIQNCVWMQYTVQNTNYIICEYAPCRFLTRSVLSSSSSIIV